MYTRRDFLKTTALGSACIGFNALPVELLGNGSNQKLVVLHTNDTHSRIEPLPDDGRRHAGLGGMARRAALIDSIRKEEDHVLLLDAGDIFQGTPYFNVFGGELEFKLMSDMKYDAATLGNHDFDNGIEGLKKQLPHAKFPFLIANYDFSQTSLAGKFSPYKVFHKGNLKIGVFGLGIALKGLVIDKLFGNTKYLDPVSVAKKVVRELKDQQCDLIICLSHLGFKYADDKISDVKLAQQVAGIDLIIGGHTHTFMNEPETVQNPDNKPVLINQVGWGGINLGRIDYNFQRSSSKRYFKSTALKVN